MALPANAPVAPANRRAPAALVETHVSVIVLVGDLVYKLKKPVTLPFLDFATLESRAAACNREIELNRRLAPDVYLGVASVLGPDGEVCDHLVVMRRMPEERRLSLLVTQGVPLVEEVRGIARVVAGFHARAERSPAIAVDATRDAVAHNWEDNLAATRQHAGGALDPAEHARVETLARRYLAGRQALFDRRIAEGRVVDGHGDLLADDIYCLDDGPRILDCIEFADRLRHLDVLDDAGFLAMDLERLGAPELAATFLAAYEEASGEVHPATLVEHYLAYRAHVRCKIACLRVEAGVPGAADTAAQLLGLAARHLEGGRVRLVLVGGLPGTGKSTLAAGLARRQGWRVLRSDVVRKELAGLAPDAPAGAPYREGLYRPELTEATYRALLDRAAALLALGEPVVLDASWSDTRWRSAAGRIARDTSSDLLSLRCSAPGPLAARRLADRAAARAEASDATPAVAEAMAHDASPWPDATAIDTSGDPEASLAAALAEIGR